MDRSTRLTKRYDFKSPDLSKLRELVPHVTDRVGFRHRYGNLIRILNTKVEDEVLNVLLQFYDPLYHCFTFRDYQLVPTLEEYACHLGLPVNEKEPYNGCEGDLDLYDVANALSLDLHEVKQNWIQKDKLRGLWGKFLFKKAFCFAEEKNTRAVEAIFALLMYGLVLFPDEPWFVDHKAIKIFLIGNPVPTLLADAYYAIHKKVTKGRGGNVVCCTQLLFNWYVSHLPQSLVFEQNSEGLSWSKRVMSITAENVKWHNDFYGEFVIDKCGKFPNVPLIGTRGGITYNPSHARRQFGFPMVKAPENILLEGHFYTDGRESLDLKAQFMVAWEKVHKKTTKTLGKTNCVAAPSYTDWITARAAKLKMPFKLEEPIRVIEIPSSTDALFKTNDELLVLLKRMTEDRDMWKAKCLESERERKKWKMLYDYIEEEKDAWVLQDRAHEEEIAALKKRLRNK